MSQWLGIPLLEVYDVDEITFREIRRDAFIYRMRQTESGREYLDNAWTLEQTSPDRDALRNAFA